MKVLNYFVKVFMIVAGVLMLMVLRDLINPPRTIEVEIEPQFIIYPESIYHEDNAEFVEEVAFNLGVEASEVTQEQFNERYID